MLEEVDLPVAIPLERWDVDYGTGASAEVIQSNMLRFAALADGVTCFDAAAFRVGPAEAAAMDPQQRVLLEQVYGALQVRLPTFSTGSDTMAIFLSLSQSIRSSQSTGKHL